MEEKGNKLVNFYRLQNIYRHEEASLFSTEDVIRPIQRVYLDDNNAIQFNPNSQKYIYFSPEKSHHMYFLFKKLLQIINTPNIHITDRTIKDIDKIKCVKAEFMDKIRIDCLQSFTLQTLPAIKEFLKACAVPNKKKVKYPNAEFIPEVSDLNKFGGGVGIADEWLELLKATSFFAETSNISLSNLFQMIQKLTELGYPKNKTDLSPKNQLFELYKFPTSQQILLPETLRNNQICVIRKILDNIYDHRRYNIQNSQLNDAFFISYAKKIEDEFKEFRQKIKTSL